MVKSTSTFISDESLRGSPSFLTDSLAATRLFPIAGCCWRQFRASSCGQRPRRVANGHANGSTKTGRRQAASSAHVSVAVSHVGGAATAKQPFCCKIITPVKNATYERNGSLPAFWPAACFYGRVVRQSSVRTTPTPNARKEAGIYGRDIQSNVRPAVPAEKHLVLSPIPGADETRTGPQVTDRPVAGTAAGPRPACQRRAGRLTDPGPNRGSVLADATWAVGNQNGSLDRKESTP